MPVPLPFFHAIATQISIVYQPFHLRRTSVERLAILVAGIMASQSCVVSRVARKVDGLGVTRATDAASIERRLRRTLGDRRLVRRAYEALLARLLPWEEMEEVVLIVDESSKRAHLHLLRMSLAYRGGVIPLAWILWRQQVALPAGRYWQEMDRLLVRAASLLPADCAVTVLADRAYDIPPFIDRLTARGWHWIIRCKGQGTIRFQDQRGTEAALADLVRAHLPGPDRRWKTRGKLFKQAGWREASIVAIWERTADEPLVVITDLAPRWEVLRTFGSRAWIEPGFRQEKSRGWQWEECQVPDLGHQHTLLLAMAWASVLTLLLGTQQATAALARIQQRERTRPPLVPQHARYSLFSLGLHFLHQWIDRHDRRRLPAGLPPPRPLSWNDQWRALLSHHYIFQSVRP
ncbi:MAG: transposase [Chloroflexota bacterium]|nr:transposase [Chloroflexota bacterium]